jgi:hypothetical protein
MQAAKPQTSCRSRIFVERNLIQNIKKKFPETTGMKDGTVVVDWALRKFLEA